jgi:hypothetical protein
MIMILLNPDGKTVGGEALNGVLLNSSENVADNTNDADISTFKGDISNSQTNMKTATQLLKVGIVYFGFYRCGVQSIHGEP